MSLVVPDGPGRRVDEYGDAALLVTPAPGEDVRRLAQAATAGAPAAVIDVVAGLDAVVVVWEPGTVDRAALAQWLVDVPVGAHGGEDPRRWRVPVAFGGPDTDEVCAAVGIEAAEVAGILTSARLEVAAVGFSPGFAYLSGVPAPLDRVGRRSRPRVAVPAGALALADGMAAVYPQATPGGWALVGWSPLVLFDPTTPPYALLRPGDEVRFDVLADGAAPAWDTDGAPVRPGAADRPPLRAARAGGGAALVVEEPGTLTTVQDAGRRHVAGAGVPRGGPADPLAYALANRLVGNADGAAALEVTVRGPVLRAQRPLHVAVVGPSTALRVDGREVRAGHVVPLAAGQRLAIGPVAGGLRAYLAVAGGIDVERRFESRSSDTLSWLGPGPLRPGDELGLAREGQGPPADHLGPGAERCLQAGRVAHASHFVMGVLPGPHRGEFPPGALERLTAGRWRVEPSSDRTGVRLGGTAARIERRPGEIRSVGMVHGAVQVPPDGMPVVLGVDHATLGGYPVLAVVSAADRRILGQCRPGDTVSFVAVSTAGADLAAARQRRTVATGVVGRYPVRAG